MDDDLVTELRAAFSSACVDAGTDPSRVRIWFAHGDPFAPGVPPSVHYGPEREIESDDLPIFDEEARAQANCPECLSLHRIAVQAGIDPTNRVAVAAVIGLIRHEVEHARQYDGVFGRQLKDLDGLAEVIADHLDGAERVSEYRSRFVESSANAAAARFLKRRCPEQRAQLAGGKFAPFADDGEVLSPDLLAHRTVEWIQEREYRADEADLFYDGLHWDERLDAEMPGASRWRK